MLYRFKSKACGDVVMLEPTGRRVLEILGKDPDGPGIILPEQMPTAIEALQAAVAAEEAEAERQRQEAQARGEAPPVPCEERVPLRTRVAPFIDMLRHSLREQTEVVWGV
ncbi:DUF1840 domain-containing protein [Tepidimonas taiwanensis]|uniref:DUF1840 domain-containing protein n=1 Tax=Tepidimonas taiwanensis TaxID=307486 RepID=A0A554XA25_9BURK|nr:DUF1840 domain-containing protein [Tepidimonas taiwanensis]MCX7692269.1 DUF1840 domain-containing protein [Tepidimonas taiwanensis]MDM7463778.1 DUF1840 domain-containing protein [Tepidimonas taiwanensis]TSE32695.1 hypothetical protein Ttaiw_01027 [Tepidimonas taiwanensis]UBQ05432.1 DUF1840 domain-containing protein [Tepidimonas taiwanensis]